MVGRFSDSGCAPFVIHRHDSVEPSRQASCTDTSMPQSQRERTDRLLPTLKESSTDSVQP